MKDIVKNTEKDAGEKKPASRRQFLKGGLAAAGGAAALAAPQVSRAQTMTLRMQSGRPGRLPGDGQAVHRPGPEDAPG